MQMKNVEHGGYFKESRTDLSMRAAVVDVEAAGGGGGTAVPTRAVDVDGGRVMGRRRGFLVVGLAVVVVVAVAVGVGVGLKGKGKGS